MERAQSRTTPPRGSLEDCKLWILSYHMILVKWIFCKSKFRESICCSQLYWFIPYHSCPWGDVVIIQSPDIMIMFSLIHDDFIKWKHFPHYWPFVKRIHRSPVNSPRKGQWRGALMFPLICAWINGWVNNREAGDLRRHRAHYDVIVMHSLNQGTIIVIHSIISGVSNVPFNRDNNCSTPEW